LDTPSYVRVVLVIMYDYGAFKLVEVGNGIYMSISASEF